MKNKEKLERAGWIYEFTFGKFEIYSRGNLRLLFEAKADHAQAYYDASKDASFKGLTIINENLFEILTEKLN